MPATSTIVRARPWSDALLSLPLSSQIVHSFAHRDSFADAWRACVRPDYLLLVAGELVRERGSPFHKSVVHAAIACAATTLDFAPEGDERPRLALRAVVRWCGGVESLAGLGVASRFADAATHDCPRFAALAALHAVHSTAFSANDARLPRTADRMHLADAAQQTGRFAMNAREDARGVRSRQLADMVRAIVPVPPIGEAGL